MRLGIADRFRDSGGCATAAARGNAFAVPKADIAASPDIQPADDPGSRNGIWIQFRIEFDGTDGWP
jgi:hypothetical protein